MQYTQNTVQHLAVRRRKGRTFTMGVNGIKFIRTYARTVKLYDILQVQNVMLSLCTTSCSTTAATLLHFQQGHQV